MVQPKTNTPSQDKVVLVTGGAKGVGRMISEAFVRNGARVYIASRDAAACHAACDELNALPTAPTPPSPSSPSGSPGSTGTAIPLPADLSSLAECERLAAALAAREPRLHVLVNNSGATWGEAYDSYPDAAWSKLLTLNVQRVFALTRLLTPLLESPPPTSSQRKKEVTDDPGRVIHIGSIDALRVPLLPTFAYSASKAALHHLSRHLAVELGPRGVTSNTLACGPFPSRMMAATLRNFGEEIKAANPLGRIGLPEDVGGACLFLASRAGAFVNGATLALDGGVSLMSKI